jgi:multidrug efflux pump
MILSDTSVKRPVFATVISLLLMVFGFISYERLPVREYPDVDAPIVSIETTYTGAAAAVIDTRITKVIEDQISGIEGIRTIDSKSRDGESEITVEFEISRDIDAAANDLRDRVSRVQDQLPDEADPPQITKVDADAQPIMWFNMLSEQGDRMALSDYADRFIVDRLAAIDGVARVRISAQAVPAMRVWIDRKALAARNLTIEDVENALRRQNIELPAGRVESTNTYLTVRLERPYATVKEFAGLVIDRSGADGYLTRLADVARIEVAPRNEKSEYRGDGKSMIGLGIVRTSGSNALEVARSVRAEVERIAETLPAQLAISPSYDSTVFIEAAMHEVWLTFGIAAACVVLVIFAFLRNIRATFIPMIAVPVSILAAFMVMYAMGFSINLLTLLALVLAIGLVVDDAIVVLENIYRRMELGESPLVASYRGARQVGFAVVATTAVLMAVFIPIVFLSGISGRVFTELAIAMAAAVGFSGLVALTLSPMLCSKLLKSPNADSAAAAPTAKPDGLSQRVYAAMLRPVINAPSIAIIAVVSIGVLTAIIFSRTPQEFTPAEDRGAFFVNVKGPEGAGFEYMQKQMREIEADLLKYIENGEAIRVIARTPGAFGDTEIFNDGRGIVVLEPWGSRTRSGLEIIEEVRQTMQRHAAVRAVPFMRRGLSQRGDQAVQFVVGGSEYADLVKARDHIFERARQNPGLVNVDADYQETKPQLIVNIDSTRASDLGVSTQVIGRTLETLMGSRQVTTYIDRGEEYDVVLQARAEDRVQPSDLTNIFVRSSTTQQLIPLSNVVSLSEVADAGLLPRYNKLRAITITASLAPGYTLGEALNFLENIVRTELPQVSKVDYKGESLEFRQASQSMLFILGLALVIVFLVLAAQFESFIHPVIIIITVPLALFGAALALYFTGATLNIFAQLGILMLIGIAAKNGILIVEFANQMRDEGMEVRDALMRACKDRLRPIMMTSIATAAGAVPLVLATGAGAETRAVIGLVILAGITSATVFTLFLVPAFYALLAPYTRSPNAVAQQLAAEQREISAAKTPAE